MDVHGYIHGHICGYINGSMDASMDISHIHGHIRVLALGVGFIDKIRVLVQGG